MTPSPSRPPSTAKFPVEIITEEKMSLVEDAFSSPAAAATSPSVLFDRNARSISSVTRLAKRRLSVCTELGNSDIEDSGRVIGSTSSNSKNRKSRVLDSFLHRFRRGRGLSVNDITSTEWCEKQMEFSLLEGRPKSTETFFKKRKESTETMKAGTETFFKKRKESTETMKAGSARHMELEEEVKRVKIEVESIEDMQAVKLMNLTEAKKSGIARHMELEEEVVKRVKIDVESIEGMWAAKFMYFIWGTNQLLAEGLTRELPVVGFAEGVWMVGIIDEIRMPLAEESGRRPILVETKTRVRATPPAEPQMRNRRLQLMCYKYLWDSLVAGKFPSQKFFSYFSLNPDCILSPQVTQVTEKSGFPSQTLGDLVRYFTNRCYLLPRAQDQLLLRYELQEDRSLLGEDQFDYEPEWFESQIKSCVEFWQGEREAICTPAEERWKCKFCKFSSECPAKSNVDDSITTPPENKDFISPEIPLKNELS